MSSEGNLPTPPAWKWNDSARACAVFTILGSWSGMMPNGNEMARELMSTCSSSGSALFTKCPRPSSQNASSNCFLTSSETRPHLGTMGEITSLPCNGALSSSKSPTSSSPVIARMAASQELVTSSFVPPRMSLPKSALASSAALWPFSSLLDPIRTWFATENLAASPFPRVPVPPTIASRTLTAPLTMSGGRERK